MEVRRLQAVERVGGFARRVSVRHGTLFETPSTWNATSGAERAERRPHAPGSFRHRAGITPALLPCAQACAADDRDATGRRGHERQRPVPTRGLFFMVRDVDGNKVAIDVGDITLSPDGVSVAGPHDIFDAEGGICSYLDR